MIEGPPGTLFEGGLFPALLKFPPEYPNKPPIMQFTTPNFWHPSINTYDKILIFIV